MVSLLTHSGLKCQRRQPGAEGWRQGRLRKVTAGFLTNKITPNVGWVGHPVAAGKAVERRTVRQQSQNQRGEGPQAGDDKLHASCLQKKSHGLLKCSLEPRAPGSIFQLVSKSDKQGSSLMAEMEDFQSQTNSFLCLPSLIIPHQVMPGPLQSINAG